jgi:hypothetical protein
MRRAGVRKTPPGVLDSTTKPPLRSGATNPAGPQNGAQVQQQTIFSIDESGFYPLPSVVRPSAPVGQTPILREWCTHDHLSAISAISPAGELYFHAQEHLMNSADVVAFWEHLLREVPGRLVLI